MNVFKRLNPCFLLFIAGILLFWAGVLMLLAKAMPDTSSPEHQHHMNCTKTVTEDVWTCKHY